jgi:Zn-dependent protease
VRRFRLRAGSLAGIPLWIHISWFVVLGLVVWSVTVEFGSALPELPLAERLAMAWVTGIAFFVCLAVHEVAHAVVARRFAVRVRGITLFLLGGVAEIEGELPTPGSEFAVALAGPATSVAIASVFALGSRVAHGSGWTGAEGVLFTLSVVNLGVAVFNLIPGLPLDGGRILRAAIWRRTGSFVRATRIAAVGGRVVAAALVAIGIAVSLAGDPVALWYLPMGVFIWFLARASGRATPPVKSGALALRREGEAA